MTFYLGIIRKKNFFLNIKNKKKFFFSPVLGFKQNTE